MVGFTDKYVKHTLVIPFWCDVAVMLVSFLDGMTREMMSSLQFATGWFMHLAISSPGPTTFFCLVVYFFYKCLPIFIAAAVALASAISCFMVWAIYHLQRRHRMHKKLMQDVANVKQLTYALLMEDANAQHVVMYLRDEIAMHLFPTSKAERGYIISKVWPRVVSDVRHNNRVLKSSTLVQGTPRDVWQWTASVVGDRGV